MNVRQRTRLRPPIAALPAAACALALMAPAGPVAAQQVPDSTFTPRVSAPAYAPGSGPVVAVDAAHRNFHTLGERYKPFGDILSADGYRVRETADSLSAGVLAGMDVLVIANAGLGGDASWELPTPSAFSAAEIAAVVAWVEAGGALFLIADHMPAAGAAANLAGAFGLRLTNGYTIPAGERSLPGDLFTRESGLLRDHPVTRGRSAREQVDSVLTFTGQAFQADARVDTLLRFGPGAVTFLPVVAGTGFDEKTPRVDSGGWIHAATLVRGRGRVAVFGEAAMFSAQLAGPTGWPMGLNHPRARENEQLLLNVMHWLTGLLDAPSR